MTDPGPDDARYLNGLARVEINGQVYYEGPAEAWLLSSGAFTLASSRVFSGPVPVSWIRCTRCKRSLQWAEYHYGQPYGTTCIKKVRDAADHHA